MGVVIEAKGTEQASMDRKETIRRWVQPRILKENSEKEVIS